MRELLADLTEVIDQARDCVYCTIVETRGSTPQKAGAAMLVFPDGSQRGTLGGGCVEAEVKQRALRVLAENSDRPELLTFNLDNDYGWDDGLICGGRMTVLADPLVASQRSNRVAAAVHYYGRFRDLAAAGCGCTEAVVLADQAEVPAGSRFLFGPDARLTATISYASGGPSNGEDCPEQLRRFLVPVQKRPQPATHQGVAYLPILPRITLLIVGGGHVGQAVGRLAAEVDFDIWVLDDRAQFANADRFPTAKKHLVGDIGRTLRELVQDAVTESTYCIIVTRGHNHDEEALYHLARTNAGYVGMIGSKRKIRMIFEDLAAKGIPTDTLAKVHAPLGFAIGSQTVPEIAVSIVAELIACRNLGHTIPEARTRVKPETVRESRPSCP